MPDTSDEATSIIWSSSPHSVAAHRRLAKSLYESYPALVFVNSRNAAESVSQRLQGINPDLKLGVHHGSLAAETRVKMEESLRNGDLHAIVCTSSLELGIDIGSIKRVHQIQSPRAVDRLLQRMGRQGQNITSEVPEEGNCWHGRLTRLPRVRLLPERPCMEN